MCVVKIHELYELDLFGGGGGMTFYLDILLNRTHLLTHSFTH